MIKKKMGIRATKLFLQENLEQLDFVYLKIVY